MSKQEKLFSRGVGVNDLKEIATKGPNIFNPREAPKFQIANSPFAPFYYHEDGVICAQTRAVYVAGEYNRLPVVITIKVTRENFPLVCKRMARVVGTNPMSYGYETPRSYDDLTGDEYIISLAGLDLEVLRQLEVKIGRLGTDGQFAYSSYEDFCNEVRAGIGDGQELVLE